MRRLSVGMSELSQLMQMGFVMFDHGESVTGNFYYLVKFTHDDNFWLGHTRDTNKEKKLNYGRIKHSVKKLKINTHPTIQMVLIAPKLQSIKEKLFLLNFVKHGVTRELAQELLID